MTEQKILLELTPDELEKATIILGAFSQLMDDEIVKDIYKKLRRVWIQNDN